MTPPVLPNQKILINDITADDRAQITADIISVMEEKLGSRSIDEDVRIYLAHLFFASALPEFREMAEPYLSYNGADILRWIRSTEDRTIRYFVFKVNADYFMLEYIFKGSCEAKEWRGLAQLYYKQAAEYYARVYKHKEGVGWILEKISANIRRYSDWLCGIGQAVDKITQDFLDAKMKKFERDFNQYGKIAEAHKTTDELLDAFNQGRIDAETLQKKMKGEGS